MPLPVRVVRGPRVNKPLTASGPFTPRVAPERGQAVERDRQAAVDRRGRVNRKGAAVERDRVLAGDAVDRVRSRIVRDRDVGRSMTTSSDGRRHMLVARVGGVDPVAGGIPVAAGGVDPGHRRQQGPVFELAQRRPEAASAIARRRMERLAAASEVCDERLNFRAWGFS